MSEKGYRLVDSGDGQKLEQFGPYLIIRPCAQAVWKPNLAKKEWQKADALFSREQNHRWTFYRPLPDSWSLTTKGITFQISLTDFGHLGIFPEQEASWQWLQEQLSSSNLKEKPKVLNLFAYSGGSTLAAAKAGASVCHLDASKGMVSWARENAKLNGLEQAPIRWIVEDVRKFLARELKRGSRYEGIILDPPSFGRGSKGELFKIEEEIIPLLQECKKLLSDQPLFLLFSCHTPGFSPLVMNHLLSQIMQGESGKVQSGEMVLQGTDKVFDLPSGTFARWTKEKAS